MEGNCLVKETALEIRRKRPLNMKEVLEKTPEANKGFIEGAIETLVGGEDFN